MSDIKRLNYFMQQFLVDTDFNDQQFYHRDMRLRHNQAFHTWGVADGGFQVTGSGTSVGVSAGMALDSLGQEIILLSAQTLDLSTFGKNADVFVTIQYQDVASDFVTVGGVSQNTRWAESPKLQATASAPASDGLVIPLAKVHLDGNGKIQTIDPSIRPVASSKIAPASNLQVGSLSVSGDASVGGKVGIGTTIPQTKLDVQGPNATLNIETAEIIHLQRPSVAGVKNDNSVGLRVGAFETGGIGGTRLDIALSGTANDANKWGGVADATIMSLQANGNVGIGTTQPGAKLEINDGDLLFKAAVEDPGDIVFQNAGGTQKGRIWSNPSAGAGLFLSSGDNTPDIAIDANGNVGIGTPKPGAKLDVINANNSAIRALSNAVGSYTSYQLGRTGVDSNWAIAAAAGQWAAGSAPGDVILRTEATSQRLILNSGAGASTLVVSNGNVGIGTTSPNYPLSLGINLANTKLAIWDGGANGVAFGLGVQGGQFRFHLNQASDRFSFLNGAAGTEIASLSGNGDVALLGKHALRGNDNWLRLNQDGAFSAGVHTPGNFAPVALNVGGLGSWGNPGSGNVWIAGNVGIGTTSPKTSLHIPLRGLQIGDSATDTDNFHLVSDTADQLRALRLYSKNYGNGVHLLSVTPAGNVGIGTTSPTGKLHVVGNLIRLEGADKRTLDMHTDWGAVDIVSSMDLYINNNDRWTYIKNLRTHQSGSYSSRELKENIHAFSGADAVKYLADLNAVVFNFKDDARKEARLGFIAEETPDILATPDRKAIFPMHFITVLTRVAQEQQKMITSMQQEIEILNQQIKIRKSRKEKQA